jgi:hypothetical protein
MPIGAQLIAKRLDDRRLLARARLRPPAAHLADFLTARRGCLFVTGVALPVDGVLTAM